jgi:hypothetical protein
MRSKFRLQQCSIQRENETQLVRILPTNARKYSRMVMSLMCSWSMRPYTVQHGLLWKFWPNSPQIRIVSVKNNARNWTLHSIWPVGLNEVKNWPVSLAFRFRVGRSWAFWGQSGVIGPLYWGYWAIGPSDWVYWVIRLKYGDNDNLPYKEIFFTTK